MQIGPWGGDIRQLMDAPRSLQLKSGRFLGSAFLNFWGRTGDESTEARFEMNLESLTELPAVHLLTPSGVFEL